MLYGETLIENKNLKIIKGDIRNTELIKKTIKGNDIVIFLAWRFQNFFIKKHYKIFQLLPKFKIIKKL